MNYLDLLKKKEKEYEIKTNSSTKILKEFADQVTEFIGHPAKVDIFLGGIVENKQEYRCVLSCPPLNYAQVIFYVYVSLKNESVSFYRIGSKKENNIKDLYKRLMSVLEEITDTIMYLKNEVKKINKR